MSTIKEMSLAKGIPPAAFMREMIEKKADLFGPVLPQGFTREWLAKFALVLGQQASKNADIMQCSPVSVLQAAMVCAGLGIIPNTHHGHAFLIPFKSYNKQSKTNTVELQLVLGYKGLATIARRQGLVKGVETHVVFDCDVFDVSHSFSSGESVGGTTITHKPMPSGAAQPVAVYAVAYMPDGSHRVEVMFWHEVEAIREMSPGAYKTTWKDNKPAGKEPSMSHPWWQHTVEMARKTVLRRLMKWLFIDDSTVSAAIAIDDRGDTANPITFGATDEADIVPDIDAIVVEKQQDQQPGANVGGIAVCSPNLNEE